MTSKSAKSNRINVKNLKYCLLTTDNNSGTTYGEVKDFGKAMQIQLTPSVSKGELYGEGVKQEDVSILNGIAVVADVNKVFAAVSYTHLDVYKRQPLRRRSRRRRIIQSLLRIWFARNSISERLLPRLG